ncbi:hypothetical protein E4P36_33800, partial [Streptomyces sp. 4R-3d]
MPRQTGATDPAADPNSPSPGRRRLRAAAVTAALGAALFLVGAVALSPLNQDPGSPKDAQPGASSARGSIAALREDLRRLPENPVGWAQLGMAYVQQGRTTADPAVYAKA